MCTVTVWLDSVVSHHICGNLTKLLFGVRNEVFTIVTQVSNVCIIRHSGKKSSAHV